MKKVSIIIPVYNGSNYLAEAIDSALAQTYKNIEIMVINDGSTDNGETRKIALSYGNKIKYIEKSNGGVSTALNLGIEKMTGDYFCWLSHDDKYYPNKIERQIEETKKYDDNTILFSNYDFIDEKGKKFDTVCLNHELLENKPDYAVLRGCIGGITLLIPKHVLDEVGPFSTELRCVQDYEMWFRMLDKYQFRHMEDILSMTRIHPKQDTQTSPKMITEGNWLWTYMSEKYPKKKKIACEGSEYLFYKEMENYLKGSPYKEAVQNVHDLAEKCIEELQEKSQNHSTTIFVIDSGSKEELEKTINSLKKQTAKNITIIIEGNTKIEKYENTKNREDSLKHIKTDYYTFIHAGVTADINWIEKQVFTASLMNKAILVSDYKRPLRTEASNNYCAFITPLDGVIFKSNIKANYETSYQYMLDIALQGGSFVTEDTYLQNVVEDYSIDEILDYEKRVLQANKSTPQQLVTLNYDIAVLYNHIGTDGKKVYMYEPCDEYRELKYSRSFQLFAKYYNHKKKKKKTL